MIVGRWRLRNAEVAVGVVVDVDERHRRDDTMTLLVETLLLHLHGTHLKVECTRGDMRARRLAESSLALSPPEEDTIQVELQGKTKCGSEMVDRSGVALRSQSEQWDHLLFKRHCCYCSAERILA